MENEISLGKNLPDFHKEKSVFDLQEFPYTTKPFRFTPKNVMDAYNEYASSTITLADVFKKHGINYTTWIGLKSQYREIEHAYARARVAKAQHYGDQIQHELDGVKTEKLYMTDKWGNNVLTSAGEKYIEHRHRMLIKAAQVAETGSFVDQQRIDQRSQNVNVNANITVPDPRAMQDMSLDDMMRFMSGDGVKPEEGT